VLSRLRVAGECVPNRVPKISQSPEPTLPRQELSARPHLEWEDAHDMVELPTGTVTLLFTDVDHSTELVKRLQERYAVVLATHRDLLRASFAEHRGVEVDTQGDAFFIAFDHARDAVEAAVAAQRALQDHTWRDDVAVAIRVGLHTGEPYATDHGYTGLAVHRAARICTLAHGGQVLLSRATAGIVDDDDIAGVSLRDLGEHWLKDFDRPERIFQLNVEGLRTEFPPLRAIDRQPPLRGTVTVVMAEGRRMMRLMNELPREHFGALLMEYQRLLPRVFEEMGGREIDVAGDSVAAGFATAKEAAFAAAAAQRAVAAHDWPYDRRPAISVGVHSGEAGIGWLGPAAIRCSELCDAAEGGQIFLSQATASLLEDAALGELFLRDLGERKMRRVARTVRAHELVLPTAEEAATS
jgi:class 3 adenylate cyclase